jgi:hypothetical protein
MVGASVGGIIGTSLGKMQADKIDKGKKAAEYLRKQDLKKFSDDQVNRAIYLGSNAVFLGVNAYRVGKQVKERMSGDSGSSSNSYRQPWGNKSTSETKSKDREAKYRNANIDPEKARARVKDLRDKVAKAQRDGTVTAEMIDELQEAMAQAKAARSNMAHWFGGYSYYIGRDSDGFAHHGIKGQRWGIRRYQNPDGSLTEAGRRRQYKHDYRKTGKAVEKFMRRETRDKKHGKDVSGNYKNRKRVYNKISRDLKKNPDMKKYIDTDNALYKSVSAAAKRQGIDPKQVVIDGDMAAELTKLRNKAASAQKSIVNKYMDEYSSATLADMGVEDTDGGRDYVKNKLRSMGWERAF